MLEESQKIIKTAPKNSKNPEKPAKQKAAKPKAECTAKQFFAKVLFTLGLFVLIFASIYVAAFAVSFIMIMLLGDKVNQPVWTTIYQALAYIFAAVIVIFGLPAIAEKITKLIAKHGEKNTKIDEALAEKSVASTKSTKTGDPLLLTEKSTRDSLGLTGLPTWTDLGLAPIALIAALIVGYVLLAVFSFFPWFNAEQTQEIGYSTTIIGIDRIFAFVAICIIAPIAEELIFRGWLYGKQRLKTSAIFAIIFNAAFFGLMHGQWNVALSVGAMGAAACLLREITGTIYAGILLHILKNTIAFLLLFTLGM